MTYRAARGFEVREALWLWLRGEGICAVERLDRKTVRRYVNLAEVRGLVRTGAERAVDRRFSSAR